MQERAPMRAAAIDDSMPGGTAGAYGRGVLGALVMALSLGTAVALGELAHLHLGVSGTTRQMLEAVVCSVLAVPSIVLLRRRVDRRSMRGLGLPGVRRSLVTFALGVLVTAGAAAVVLGFGASAGWVRFGGISVQALLVFLVTSTVIALLFEALPEELTLRGYAFASLNARMHRWTAALWTTALFIAVPAVSGVVKAAILAVAGQTPRAPGFAPQGMNPLDYLILLAIFGAALIIARIATGSLWTAIGLHLTFLAVSRIVLLDSQATGWSVALVSAEAILLIPAYLLLTATIFLALARCGGWRVESREREPG